MKEYLYLSDCESTQDVAKECIKDRSQDEIKSGYFVISQNQSRGRGRRGREWLSCEGNYFASFILRANEINIDSSASLRAGLALLNVLRTLNLTSLIESKEEKIKLKWPNDLVLDKKNIPPSKLAGLLLEGQIQGDDQVYVLGVGLNWKQIPKPLDHNKNHFCSLNRLESLNEKLSSYLSQVYLAEIKRIFALDFDQFIQAYETEALVKTGQSLNWIDLDKPNVSHSGVLTAYCNSGELKVSPTDWPQKEIILNHHEIQLHQL